jgi:hypothetical protein
VVAPVSDSAATAAATKRLGAAALIMHLTLRYRFAGFDQVASSHDVWWTFVRRHGRVVIAGDSDMANLGGASWRGPWEYGPQDVAVSGSSLVFVPRDSSALLPVIAGDADAAVAAVSAQVPSGWPKRVVVVLARSTDEIAALGAQTPSLADISALLVSDQQDPVSGKMPGIRILLNPTEFAKLSTLGRGLVLRHEITHAATLDATGDASPRWLIEGYAEYVANLGTGLSVERAAAELHAKLATGYRPSVLPVDADFVGSDAAVAYEQAWLACSLIAQRVGAANLLRFYRAVGASPDSETAAVAAALRSVLHTSTAAFTADWRAYLEHVA